MQNSSKTRVIDVCRGMFVGITLAALGVYAYLPTYTANVKNAERVAYIEDETQRFNQIIEEKLRGYQVAVTEAELPIGE